MIVALIAFSLLLAATYLFLIASGSFRHLRWLTWGCR